VDYKQSVAKILKLYGEKFHELRGYLEAWTRGEKKDLEHFKLKIPPTRIFIEPTNQCNRNCVYCAHNSMTREVSSLSMEAFKNIIDGLPEGTYINMLGNGEPTLNPDVYGMIRYAVDKGFLVAIITNASTLNATNGKKLLESGVHRIQISFDSVVKKVFDYCMQSQNPNLSYERTLKDIIDFIYYARMEYSIMSPFITISAVMIDEVSKVRKINRKFWKALPIDNYYEGPFLNFCGDTEIGGEQDFTKRNEWKMCANPFTSVKINSDGTVNPCILDISSKCIAGNIREYSLKQICNNDTSNKLRKAIYEKDLCYLSGIGINCHHCNAWTSMVGHDIEGYLCDAFPITYGLMLKEIETNRPFDASKMHNLEFLKENFNYKTIAHFAGVDESMICS